MIYGSVCSGIEAATQAWHPLGWTPAFFSEIEKFPSQVLAHHYGSNMPGEPASINGVPNYGDMTKFKDWPSHAIDLLVGGTPCQSFSVAGLRKGLDDPRGNLMLTYLAIARRYKPRWLVWENVPGVLSSNKGRDFGTFLAGLGECGYGVAYRVLDAQFVRVDGFGRAVPQRRRRVFVVGYLGDWRRAAAVLLEPESLRGDPAPSRKAGKGITGNASSRAFGGGNTSGDIDVSTALTAHGVRQDFEVETFVAHALRGEGFDASEDGTGRGTPIVPVEAKTLTRGAESNGKGGYAGRRQEDDDNIIAEPLTLAILGRDGSPDIEWRQDGTANAILTPNGGRAGVGVGAIAIQAGALRQNPESGPDGVGVQADLSYTLEARAEVQAVAFVQNERDEVRLFGGDGQSVGALAAEPGAKQQAYIATSWAVRRLMPVECERLQGFPDGYTDIMPKGKPTPDGPRYKALGNSMAVNVMRWIGRRIEMVDEISREIDGGRP